MKARKFSRLSGSTRPRGVYATSGDRQRHPHHDYRKVRRKIVDRQIQFGASHVCYPSFLFHRIDEFLRHGALPNLIQESHPCDHAQTPITQKIKIDPYNKASRTVTTIMVFLLSRNINNPYSPHVMS